MDSVIHIVGNKRLELESCRRILEYNEIYVKVKSADGMLVEVWGENLLVSEMNLGGLIVEGKINSVELLPLREPHHE